MAPIVLVALILFVAILPWLFRGSFTVSPESVADVMSLNEREAINDRRLLVKCAAVLTLVFAGFLTHSLTHIEPSIIALLGAGLLVVITDLRPREYMAAVEWETLLFFAGLFIMVGALVKSGSIERLAGLVTSATGGDALTAVMLILGGSALLSGIIDNIPYVATMTPLVQSLTAEHRRPGPVPGTVVVPGSGRGLRRQPDRHRGQRQRRRAGHRPAGGPPDLVLGVHPQGRDRHRSHHRAWPPRISGCATSCSLGRDAWAPACGVEGVVPRSNSAASLNATRRVRVPNL